MSDCASYNFFVVLSYCQGNKASVSELRQRNNNVFPNKLKDLDFFPIWFHMIGLGASMKENNLSCHV